MTAESIVLARTVVLLVVDALERSRVKTGRPAGCPARWTGAGSATIEVAGAFVLELGEGSEEVGMERGMCAE